MSEDLVVQLSQHDFLKGLDEVTIRLIADCAETKEFPAEHYLMKQNTPAEVFYLMLKGHVSIRMPASQATVPIETVAPPNALGWSWLVPPYKWHYDAVALDATKTIMVHTPCILGKISEDKAFGCEIYARFMEIVVDRLHGAQMQMMDIYANPDSRLL